MVLHDIASEYATIRNHLSNCTEFINKGNEIIISYITDVYIYSTRLKSLSLSEQKDLNIEFSNNSESKFISSLSELYLNSSAIFYTLGKLSHNNFNSFTASQIHTFTRQLERVIDIIKNIIQSKLATPQKLIDISCLIQDFYKLYVQFSSLYNSQLFLEKIENELLETIPGEYNTENLVFLNCAHLNQIWNFHHMHRIYYYYQNLWNKYKVFLILPHRYILDELKVAL